MANDRANVDSFRRTLKNETERLAQQCSSWRDISKSTPNIPQNVDGDICVAIGQAELLTRERFSQFAGLIDDCEFQRGEKETTCQDLQGFWDIVSFQVEDVNRKFEKLAMLQSNNWSEPKPVTKAVIQKRIPVSKPPIQSNAVMKSKMVGKPSSSAMRAHILAARQKLKERAEMDQEIQCLQVKGSNIPNNQLVIEDKENRSPNTREHKDTHNKIAETKSPEKAVFDAGFFKVVTPVKKLIKKIQLAERCSSPGGMTSKVLSSAVLKERMRNSPVVHKDYSPCMRITRSMKAKGLGNKLSFN